MPSVNNAIPPPPPGPPKFGRARKCRYLDGQCVWNNSGIGLTNANMEMCNQGKAEEGKCSAPKAAGGKRKTRRRKKTRSRK